MQLAERVHSPSEQQNTPALTVGALQALAITYYYLGDFSSARRYAAQGTEIYHSGQAKMQVEDVHAPAVVCLCFQALSEWQLGESADCHAIMAEAVSLAEELHDTNSLAVALCEAADLAHYCYTPQEAERSASALIELSARNNFPFFQAVGNVLFAWASSFDGDPNEAITRVEAGIADYQATGSVLNLPYLHALKAEVLYRASRTLEAIKTLGEAERMVEKCKDRWWCAEMHRLRAIFLCALGANHSEIETSFIAAIATAREQNAITLLTRAKRTFAKYRRRKVKTPGGHSFRLSLC
jgi:tetratricopeptide (TPR) repeat protein